MSKQQSERPSVLSFWKLGRFIWRIRWHLIIVLILALLFFLPIFSFKWLKGSTYTENKTSFIEQIQSLNELATAEVYTKVIVERTDNQLFGQDIGVNLPGTKRQLLVVIPGSIKAGVDLSTIDATQMTVDEKNKTASITIPKATFLGDPAIAFDKIEVYSVEGLLRNPPDIQEGYDIAGDATKLMKEEATAQGALDLAEANAKTAIEELFSFVGYDVTVQVEE